jgi:anthranilate synthase component I
MQNTYSINITEFTKYAQQGYNRIPISINLQADLDTPLSIYLKLTEHKRQNSFLLESVIGGERFGRYSYIGLPAKYAIESHGYGQHAVTNLLENINVIESIHTVNPLEAIEQIQSRYKPLVLDGLPRFCGGWVGYFAYETVHYIEPCLGLPKNNIDNSCNDKLEIPNIRLLLCDELVVVDNLKGTLQIILYLEINNIEDALSIYNQGINRINELIKKLQNNVASNYINNEVIKNIDDNLSMQYNTTQQEYINNVIKAKEYIYSGDIMQVVLSQRMHREFKHDTILLYRALRQLNPSPYMYYYCFNDSHIVGSSPELLIRNELSINSTKTRTITLRPIAGTRHRGINLEQDERLANELLVDSKEIAEHTMLIDLARNDIGRIANIGTVKLTQNMKVEKYSHVQHIVSNVEGNIDKNTSNINILKAIFPAGTLSGAAKVRAMQIINTLEPMPRHIYGGGVGYMSFNGDMDLAIAIRTAVVQNNTAYVQVGAGIVADSIPELEWQETKNKSMALIKAMLLVDEMLADNS